MGSVQMKINNDYYTTQLNQIRQEAAQKWSKANANANANQAFSDRVAQELDNRAGNVLGEITRTSTPRLPSTRSTPMFGSSFSPSLSDNDHNVRAAVRLFPAPAPQTSPSISSLYRTNVASSEAGIEYVADGPGIEIQHQAAVQEETSDIVNNGARVSEHLSTESNQVSNERRNRNNNLDQLNRNIDSFIDKAVTNALDGFVPWHGINAVTVVPAVAINLTFGVVAGAAAGCAYLVKTVANYLN